MKIDNFILSQAEKKIALHVFTPKEMQVVLGASNEAHLEAHVDLCQKDKVLIVKRLGGGGTVLLYPGCVVVSLGLWVNDHYNNSLYFRLINQAINRSLLKLSPKLAALTQNGISDIVFENKKIAGTSMFRSRNYLLYQASILVENQIDLISRYLKHPSREPEYREARSHDDFLGFLADIAMLNTDQVTLNLHLNLLAELDYLLADQLSEPQKEQIKHILSKIKN